MQGDTKEEIVYLYLDDIIPNRFQPREVFDERALKELAISIKEHGVIQPIVVRNVNGKYEIIAGERRYKASAMAGLTKIPAIIRNLDDKESSKVALLENLQRRNLNPIEEARTYQKILEIDQMTQEELAKTMGKSQSAVANKIRLLGLSDEVQEALLKEKISERHARTLLNISDKKKQAEMLKKVIANKMTVRQLENEIKNIEPKQQEEKGVTMNNNEQSINSINFVNNSPLSPTAKLPEQQEEIGKIKIAPPDGSQSDAPRFINYGEINDDDDDDDEESPIIGGTNPNGGSAIPNISDIKANAVDINTPKPPPPAGDLDSLLHISSIPTTQDKDFKYITPAEAIVKEDANDISSKSTKDYFNTPNLELVNLPDSVHTSNTKSVSIDEIEEKSQKHNLLNNNNLKVEEIPKVRKISEKGQEEKQQQDKNSISDQEDIKQTSNFKKNEQFNIQKSIDMIRNLVEELRNHGVAADIDEMNFSKSYQIIIKLDKTAEQ